MLRALLLAIDFFIVDNGNHVISAEKKEIFGYFLVFSFEFLILHFAF